MRVIVENRVRKKAQIQTGLWSKNTAIQLQKIAIESRLVLTNQFFSKAAIHQKTGTHSTTKEKLYSFLFEQNCGLRGACVWSEIIGFFDL